MQLADFDFQLPAELIAQTPAEPRDSARLLVYNRSDDTIRDMHVRDLPELLPAHTHLVGNNSRVRKARLFAKAKTEGRQDRPIEVVFLEPVQPNRYRCLIGGRGVKTGTQLLFRTTSASVVAYEEGPGMSTYVLEFTFALGEIEAFIEKEGELPLPPYITERNAPDSRYQTVFARETGSAAAPTAGLHITPELIEQLQQAGHSWNEVTLHVGLGTFLPLRHQEVEANKLHTEHTIIDEETAVKLTQAKRKQHPILAIGTTATRTLESHSSNQRIVAYARDTNMFIYPGYEFRSVSCLLTNFHLPKSSLLLLVAAFLGNTQDHQKVTKNEQEMISSLHRLYAHAIAQRYRFFSFGDAMLIL